MNPHQALCAMNAEPRRLFFPNVITSTQVEKEHLARLTGHKNADSANRVWYIAKAKLMKDSSSESGTAAINPDTPTKGTKRTAAKMRTAAQKKHAKEDSEGEEAGEEEVEQLAKKRAKKAAPKNAASDVDVKGEV